MKCYEYEYMNVTLSNTHSLQNGINVRNDLLQLKQTLTQ